MNDCKSHWKYTFRIVRIKCNNIRSRQEHVSMMFTQTHKHITDQFAQTQKIKSTYKWECLYHNFMCRHGV